MARDGGRPVADSMGVRPLITHEGVPQSLLERVLHAAPPSALADYARFDQAHPSLLQAIAHRHTDLNLLTAIAESPRTPSSVLEELSRHQSVQVRRGAASNPRLPEPCARALLRDVDCSDRIAWHPCLSHEERRQLMPRGAEFVQAVIEHPEHLALLPLLMHPDFSSIQLLVDRSLSTSAIDLLASQPFPPNRMLADLSRHPNSSPELLRRIAATGRPECLEGVAANPSTPADLILELMRAKRPSRRIARLAAANPSLPASALDEAEPHLLGAWLADYQGCPGWPFMLSHPACPESRLRGHANSHDWRNRLMVAINRSTPLDVLRRLMQDGLLPLRHAAKRTLQSLGHAA
jgi:hypothetical protein